MLKKEMFHLNSIGKIGIIILFSSVGIALVRTIWAIYLKSFLGNDSYVGFVITGFTIVGIISYIAIIPLVEKKNNIRLFSLSLLLFALSYILFALFSTIYVVFFLGLVLSIFSSLRINTLGIIISDKSKNSEISKNEGIIYTFANTAWLIGPLVSGFLAEKYGTKEVFLIAALIILLSVILLKFFKITDPRKSKRIDKNLFKIVKEFFKDKNRVLSYIASGGINFWWGLIYTFIPLYILESGFGEIWVGYFLFAIVVPLIFLSYKFGKIATKKGFRKMSFEGYLIIGLISLTCFFISNPLLILGFLVLASIGGAMVESTSEAYFFDIIKSKQREKFYGVYNTAIDVNYLIASFFGAIILLIFPFKFLFLLFGIGILIISLLSLKLRNVIEERRK